MRDPDWQGGHYAPEHPPRSGMRLARKLGTITYRSAAEWRAALRARAAGRQCPAR